MAPVTSKKTQILLPYPTLRKVAPHPFTTLQNSDFEHDLFDSVAQEHTNVAGTDVDFYSHSIDTSPRDALYDEAVSRVYLGPFRLKGFVTWPDSAPEGRLEGGRTTFSAEMFVPRKSFEDARAPEPNETDVVRIWSIPFFDDWAVDGQDAGRAQGALVGYFFDVIDLRDDGHVFDSAAFVGFNFTLKRRTEFTPERRITNT